MGDFLYVRITKEKPTIHQTAYWWPLIMEAMHRANFQFPHPGDNAKEGSYFSGVVKMNEVMCTFQELWDVLSAGHDKLLVTFWFAQPHTEPFSIALSVDASTSSQWQIEATLGDGYLGSQPRE